jgi:hypothetical protein
MNERNEEKKEKKEKNFMTEPSDLPHELAYLFFFLIFNF